MSLENKVAVVTGAGSGIGRASSLKLAAEGASIVAADVDVNGGEETVALIKDAGGHAVFTRCDVTQAAEVEAMVKTAVDTFGGLDIAMNNAGIMRRQAAVDEILEDDWDRVISVNLKGVWLCMKYEIPAMLARGGGSIINTASLSGLVGTRYGADYGASKHGVIGLTKSAALEYIQQGIRVNAICPGFVDTALVEKVIELNPQMDALTQKWSPLKRRARAEEIADAVVYLAGETSSFINGHALAIDAGASAQ